MGKKDENKYTGRPKYWVKTKTGHSYGFQEIFNNDPEIVGVRTRLDGSEEKMTFQLDNVEVISEGTPTIRKDERGEEYDDPHDVE